MNQDSQRHRFANRWASLRYPCSGWVTAFLVEPLHESMPSRREAASLGVLSKMTAHGLRLVRSFKLMTWRCTAGRSAPDAGRRYYCSDPN